MIDWKAIERERKRLRRLSILYGFLAVLFKAFVEMYSFFFWVFVFLPLLAKIFLKKDTWAWYWYLIFVFVFLFQGFLYVIFSAVEEDIYKRWRAYYFRHALLPFIKSNLPDFRYKYRKFFSRDEFLASYLFHDSPFPEVYTGRDYLKGSYKGKPLECSWVSCGYYTTDEDGNSVYVDIFRGLILKLNFHKSLDGAVLLYSDGPFSLKGFNRYRLDSEEFNRSFHVYSDSEFNAFYVLDHAFMERLVKFKKAYPKVRFSFVKNTLYIALPDFYLFYIPSIDQSVLKIEKEYKQNLSLFFSLLDALEIERLKAIKCS